MDLLLFTLSSVFYELKFKATWILKNSSFGAEMDTQFHLEVTKKKWQLILEAGVVDMPVYLGLIQF